MILRLLLSLFIVLSLSVNVEAANWVKEFLQANPDVAAKPVAERGQFHYAVKNPDNSRTYYFTELPNHYFKDGEWKSLDTKLVYFADTDEYGAEGIATRIKADGTVRTQDQSYTHKSYRIGTFNPLTNTFSALVTKPIGTVKDDTITATVGNLIHKITLTETGLKEYLVLNSAVAVVGSNYFTLETEITVPDPQPPTITCPLGGDCVPNPDIGITPDTPAYVCKSDDKTPCTVTPNPDLNKQLWPDGWVDDTSIGKYRFPVPRGWDATGKAIPIKRYAKYTGGKQYLYTGVQAGSLTGVTYPVTIDPDYSDMTADAYVTGTNATYATARSTSTSFDISEAFLTVGQATGFYVYRGFLKFNTLTLPSAVTITQVNLKLTATSDLSTTDFDVQIVKQNWSAQDPLSAANREAAYDGCLAGTADSNIWRNTSGMAINTTYTSGNLDTTYPTKGGYTYYSLRSSRDFGNNTPSGTEYILLATQENATAAYRPVLVITATAKALSGYTYKKEIYLDTKADAANVSTDQSQFPVAVHINSSSWSTGAELARVLNAANTDGKRLNFYTNADQTWPLSYEVEYFSSGTEAVYWAGIPTVKGNYNESDGTLNTLWVGYEDSSGWPAADQSNKVGVYDPNFKGVWHLGDNGVSGTTYYDSTFNSWNATGSGTSEESGVTGFVRNGVYFDGTDDNFTMATSFVTNGITTAMTMSFLFRTHSTPAVGLDYFFDSKTADNDFCLFLWDTDDKFHIRNPGNTALGKTPVLSASTTYHIAVTWSSIANGASCTTNGYANGTAGTNATGTNSSLNAPSETPIFGERRDNINEITGYADELRISNTVRSADWIKLEYYSMKKTNYNGDEPLNATCTASTVPYACCTGSGTGTCESFVSWGTEQGGAPAARRIFMVQ